MLITIFKIFILMSLCSNIAPVTLLTSNCAKGQTILATLWYMSAISSLTATFNKTYIYDRSSTTIDFTTLVENATVTDLTTDEQSTLAQTDTTTTDYYHTTPADTTTTDYQTTPADTTTTDYQTTPADTTTPDYQTTRADTTTDYQTTPADTTTNYQTTPADTTTDYQTTPADTTTTDYQTTPADTTTPDYQTTRADTTTDYQTTPADTTTTYYQTTPADTTTTDYQTTPADTTTDYQTTPADTTTDYQTTPADTTTDYQTTPADTTTTDYQTTPADTTTTDYQTTPADTTTDYQTTPADTTTTDYQTTPADTTTTDYQTTPADTTTTDYQTTPADTTTTDYQTTPADTTTTDYQTTPADTTTPDYQTTPADTTTDYQTTPADTTTDYQTTPADTTTTDYQTTPADTTTTDYQTTTADTTTTDYQTTPADTTTTDYQTTPADTTTTDYQTTTADTTTTDYQTTPADTTTTDYQTTPADTTTTDYQTTTADTTTTDYQTTPADTTTDYQTTPADTKTTDYQTTTADTTTTDYQTTPADTTTDYQTTPADTTTDYQTTPADTTTTDYQTTPADTTTTDYQTTPADTTTTDYQTTPADTTTDYQTTPADTTTTDYQTTPADTTTTDYQTTPADTTTTDYQTTPADTTTYYQTTPADTTTTDYQTTPADTTTDYQTTPADTTTTDYQTTPADTTTDYQTTPADTTTTDYQTTPADTTTTVYQTTPADTTTDYQTTPADTTTTDYQTTPADTTTTDYQITPADTTTTDYQTTPADTTTTDYQTTPADTTTTDYQTTPADTTTDYQTTPADTTTDYQTTPADTTTTDYQTTPADTTTDYQTTPADTTTTDYQTTPSDTTTTDYQTTPADTTTTDYQTTTADTTTDYQTTPADTTTDYQTTPADTTTTDYQTTRADTTTTDYQTTPADTTTTDYQTTPADTTTTDYQTTPADTTTDYQTTPADTTTTDYQTTRADTTTTDYQTTPADTTTTDYQTTPADTTTTDYQTTTADTTTTDYQTTPADTTTTDYQTTPADTTTDYQTTTADTTTTDYQTTPADTTTTDYQTTPADTTTTDYQTTPADTTTDYQTTPADTTTTDYQTTTADTTTTDYQTTRADTTTTDYQTTTALTTTTDYQTTPADTTTTDYQTTPADTTTTVYQTTPADTTTTDYQSTTADTTTTVYQTTPADTTTTDYQTTTAGTNTTYFQTTPADRTTTVYQTTPSNTTTTDYQISTTANITTTMTSEATTLSSQQTQSESSSLLRQSTSASSSTELSRSVTTFFLPETTEENTSTFFPLTSSINTTVLPKTTSQNTTFSSLNTSSPSPTATYTTSRTATSNSTTVKSFTTSVNTTTSTRRSTFEDTTTEQTSVPTPATTTSSSQRQTTSTSSPTTTTSTLLSPCIRNPCTKLGDCRVNNTLCNISCTYYQDVFSGNRCTFIDTLKEATNLGNRSLANLALDVSHILNTANSQMIIAPTNSSIVLNSAGAISELAAIVSKTSMNASTLSVITQSLLNATSILMDVITYVSCDDSSASVCKFNKTQDLMSDIQESIFSIGKTVIHNSNVSTYRTAMNATGIHLSVLTTNHASSIAGKTMTTDGASITIPLSMKDILAEDGISLLISVLDQTFPSTRTSASLNITGKAFLCRMVDSSGNKVKVDSSDPITLEFGSSSVEEQQQGLNDTFIKISLANFQDSSFEARYQIVGDYFSLFLYGRYDKPPTDQTYDFSARIVKGQIQKYVKNKVKVDIAFDTSILTVTVTNPATQGAYLYVKTTFQGTELKSSRRRLLQSSSSLSMSTSSVAATYWNKDCACWSTTPDVKVIAVSTSGRVKFTTNFLGAFALSQVIIAPEIIDFNSLFLNFSEKLEDSPYVLILNCIILALTVLTTIVLRQFDISDSNQWAYLPLLGNNGSDQWHYAISVQTSVRSQKQLKAQPCLSVIGQYGHITAVPLYDGIRENFKRGTTSNFIMSSSNNLGPLMEIKIWLSVEDNIESHRILPELDSDCQKHTTSYVGSHEDEESNKSTYREDCENKSAGSCLTCCCCRDSAAKVKDELPYWKLGHVTVMDLTTRDRYTFICQDWLSKTHGDGRTFRHIPVLDSTLADSGTLFDIISKRNLCDQHLWLSIVTRPSYSIFTRVQRFLCAISFLYLAMITNAMWYRGSKSEDQDDSPTSGITIGVINITYRTFFVGVVSSIIIIVPGVLMTCMFRNRKQHFFHGQRISPARSVPGASVGAEFSSVDEVRNNNNIASSTEYNKAQRITSDHTPILVTEAENSSTSNVINQTELAASEQEKAQEDMDILTGILRPAKKSTKIPTNTITPLFPFVADPSYPSSSQAYQYSDTIQIYDIWSRGVAEARKRRGFDVLTDVPKRKQRLLPWWTIIIGYVIVVASISTSAAFTFFYSLQWGGSLSLEWMASLFVSTTAGTFVIEPIKIVLISLLLSCLLRDSAQDQLSEMAPVDPDYRTIPSLDLSDQHLPANHREPEEGNIYGKLSTELMKRRKQLKLQERLFSVFRGITFQAVFVILIGLICLHTNIGTSFNQNEVLRNHMGVINGIDSNISNHNNFYKWLRKTALPNLLPKFYYNNQLMSVYMQRYTSDLQMYRLTPISLIQKRVKSNCKVPRVIQSHFYRHISCKTDYDKTTEETDWIPCDANCSEPWFTYTSGNQWSTSQSGTVADYRPGGYQLLLEHEQNQALESVNMLEAVKWLDKLTRAVAIEFVVFNPSTRLFTQVKVLNEFPTFGGGITRLDIRSANLYPYTYVWDFVYLLAQLIFALFFRLKSDRQSKLGIGVVVEAVELTVSLFAVIAFALRVDNTIALVNFINNNPNEFASFDTVFLYDEIYTVCISSILFIRMLRFLSPLSINTQLYIMRETLISSRTLLMNLGITVMVVIVSFSSFFYIYNGRVKENSRTVPTTIITLLISLLGLAKSNDITDGTAEYWQVAVQRIVFGIFSMISTIMLLNFAICTLNVSMETVKTAELRVLRKLRKKALRFTEEILSEGDPDQRHELDREVGFFVFEKLSSLFSSCSSKQSDTPSKEPEAEQVPQDQASMHCDIHRTLEAIMEILKTWESMSNQRTVLPLKDSVRSMHMSRPGRPSKKSKDKHLLLYETG